MHVTLIRPPILRPAMNMVDLVTPPLGLAYVAAAIRAAGHEVTVVDGVGSAIETFTAHPRGHLHGLTIDEIVEAVPAPSDAIGVSVQYSYDWPVSRTLIERLRQRFPRVLLVAGGEHITALPEFSLSQSGLDVAVLGEGEASAVAVLEAWASEGRKGLGRVPGVCYRTEGGAAACSGKGVRELDLDAIPRPAWDLLPIEEYLSRHYGFGVDRGRSLPVMASRGCPFECTFCSSPAMWTTKWLARDPNDLLDEIAELQRTYQAQNFDFYDLTMIVKRQWIIDFCQAIERRGMSFVWQLPSGTRSEGIDGEVTRWLYRTGCRNVSYSPESGSVETLKTIKKKVKVARLLGSMRAAVKNDLNVKFSMIFGFPHERLRHILESFVFLMRAAAIGVHDVSIWVFVPYPGSELFHQLRASGRISTLDDEFFYRLASYADITQTFSYCEALGRRTLLTLRVIGTLIFYATSWLLRPWRPLMMLWRAAAGQAESRAEMVLRTLLRRVRRNFRLRQSVENPG